MKHPIACYLLVFLFWQHIAASADETYFPRLGKEVPPRSEAKILARDGNLIVYGGQCGGFWFNDVWLSDDRGGKWRRVCDGVFASGQAPQDYQLLWQGGSYFALGGWRLDAEHRKRMNDQVLVSEALSHWEPFKRIRLQLLNPQFGRWYSTGDFIYYNETVNSRNGATQMFETTDFEKWRWTGQDFCLYPEKRDAHIEFDSIKMFFWKGLEYWIQNNVVSLKQPAGHYELQFITPKWSYDIDMSKATVVPRQDAVYMFDYRVRRNGEWHSRIMRSADLTAWLEAPLPSDVASAELDVKRIGYASAVDDEYLYLFGGRIGDWCYGDLLRSKDLFHWEFVVPADLAAVEHYRYVRTIELDPYPHADDRARILQMMINRALRDYPGWTPLVEDGIFGAKTAAAVKKIWDVQYPFTVAEAKKVTSPTFWDALVVMGRYSPIELEATLSGWQ